jgi:uncharacterized protein (DUF2336 family)
MAADNNEQLRSLIRLAHEKTEENRRVLLENISHLFLSSAGRLSERETALMSDILGKLVHEVEMSVRRELSERLADVDVAPHDLVVTLANDEIEVAGPVLMRSGVLRDSDLIEIIKARTHEHMLAVAGRDALSEDVSDAIVDGGDDNVIEVLLRNQDAQMSRHAMEYIVDQSKRIDRFQQPLLRRADLPHDLAHRMFWWVSAALRDYILKSHTVDEVVIDDFIRDSTETVLARMQREWPGNTAAQRLIRRMAETGELTVKFLVNAVRQGQLQVFTAGLAWLCHLDLGTAQRIVLDPGGEPLAVACRAMGLERADFASVFMLTRKPGAGNEAALTINPVLAMFDSVDESNAKRALAYWREDTGYRGAVKELERAGV